MHGYVGKGTGHKIESENRDEYPHVPRGSGGRLVVGRMYAYFLMCWPHKHGSVVRTKNGGGMRRLGLTEKAKVCRVYKAPNDRQSASSSLLDVPGTSRKQKWEAWYVLRIYNTHTSQRSHSYAIYTFNLVAIACPSEPYELTTLHRSGGHKAFYLREKSSTTVNREISCSEASCATIFIPRTMKNTFLLKFRTT